MAEQRWRVLARQGANRGRIVAAFLQYHMAQQEIRTLRQLAEKLGINPGTLSWWKSINDDARTVPENKHFERLSEVLGVSRDDLHEAFGLRPTPPVPDALTREIISVVGRLSPGDQAWILELAMARLQRQHENHEKTQVLA